MRDCAIHFEVKSARRVTREDMAVEDFVSIESRKCEHGDPSATAMMAERELSTDTHEQKGSLSSVLLFYFVVRKGTVELFIGFFAWAWERLC